MQGLLQRIEHAARRLHSAVPPADSLARLDFVVPDELGDLPSAQSGGQLLFQRVSRLSEQTSALVTINRASSE